MQNVKLSGIIDIRTSAASAFAAKWKIPNIFGSAEEAIRSGEIDCVHVLTPPNIHAAAALPFLQAGIPALIEKPLAANSAECEQLQRAAASSGAAIGVNQNALHYRSFSRLRRVVEENTLGGLRSIQCLYNVPLRQISARQFDHWMFENPVNILLEQAVHPLSQIAILAGQAEEVSAVPGPKIELPTGSAFYPSFSLSLRCMRAQTQFQFAVGESFPFWEIVAVCDDGVAVADIVRDRFFTYRRTRWLQPIDYALSGMATAAAIGRASLRNTVEFGLSTLGLGAKRDAFAESMRASIGAFHQALDRNALPESDGAFGAALVEICERATRALPTRSPRAAPVGGHGDYDVLVIGGTGFIGRHVVDRLLADGYRVGIMARRRPAAGAPFDDERVVFVQGDATSAEDVDRAVGAARVVVNLAHGGGQSGDSDHDWRAAMKAVTEIVARACIEHRVERLIHIGSTAGLYLGPQQQLVTGATPPDPQSERRSEYARAKAECDRLLLEWHRTKGLPVCILRPALVVGEGGDAFHGGLGFFNNEQHCIGWNAGNNPLPFILVEDVADAIALALKAPDVAGRCYNLVGDVRLTAREYLAELALALGRPLRFHPTNPTVLWLQETGKWLIKIVGGRKGPAPTRRDIQSRGLVATFDCSDAQRDLGWQPTRDRARFVERAIRIHGRPSPCR